MSFLNHSCEPNVGFAGNTVLVAMRAVAAGEEVTTDYALFDDYDGLMSCSCATANCRSIVDGRDWHRPNCSAGIAASSPGTCNARSTTLGRSGSREGADQRQEFLGCREVGRPYRFVVPYVDKGGLDLVDVHTCQRCPGQAIGG